MEPFTLTAIVGSAVRTPARSRRCPLRRSAAGARAGAAAGAVPGAADPGQATVQQPPARPPAAGAEAAEYPIRHATPRTAAARERTAGRRPRDRGRSSGGEARAYPLNLLWHETAHTVNDELGRAPIAVALCPLAGVGSAFSRRLGRQTIELGHVSEVERDTLVLYDKDTRSRWGLLTGEAFSGPLSGRHLDRLPGAADHLGPLACAAPRDDGLPRPGPGRQGLRARRPEDPARRPGRRRRATPRRLDPRSRGAGRAGGRDPARARAASAC